MILLVCGGRDYTGDVSCLGRVHGVELVIHGGAKGADTLAGEYFKVRGVHVAVVKALWDYHFKDAGWKRNDAMLLLRPTYCVAFPGSNGTQDMIDKCNQQRITVWQPYG